MSMIFDMMDAEEKIGYSFKDKNLLRRAFTHSTYSNENKAASNESLEFLGDSVLNFVVTSYIFNKHPEMNEGKLTELRAKIVSRVPLSDTVKLLKLDEDMLLGEGERKAGALSINIYCDLYEAVVGAIYLDGGLEFAKKFILNTLGKYLNKKGYEEKDYKSVLSEYTQKNLKTTAKYQVALKKGPSHNPDFTVNVLLKNKIVSTGEGETKKAAEQAAAKGAYEILTKEKSVIE